jgi:hypothetical protein
MTDIKISAFPWVPGFAQRLVRDIRARWALKEAGLAQALMQQEITMKKFLAIYLGTPASMEASGWNALSDEERRTREKAGIEAWGKWVETHRNCIVDTGAPLGKTKRASAQGIDDAKNNICAYVVVEAKSHDAAIKLFKHHPHFTIMPGDAVEVVECLPMPAM